MNIVLYALKLLDREQNSQALSQSVQRVKIYQC